MFNEVHSGGLLVQPAAVTAQTLRQLAYHDPEHFPVLLDSAAVGPLSRYSILAAYPQSALWLDAHGVLQSSGSLEVAAGQGFLTALENAWRRESRIGQHVSDCGMPFRGGWIVFLGYELAGEVEPRLALPSGGATALEGPGAFALRVPAGVIYDHVESRAWMFAEGHALQLLPALEAALRTVREDTVASEPVSVLLREEPAERFQSRVEAALEYIAAGDIYQANLSRPWRGEWVVAGGTQAVACDLYERLRRVNPSPFAALAQFQDWRLLSCSPERLVRVTGSRVETRPIAGTRPRSGIDDRHALEIAGLIEHPKERAEHVMLIDLERNDLGRICRAGSVRPDEFMAIESYAHVHHIVSNVSGELRSDLTPIDVLRAVFPGGTITGCPKFRCMQIIAELEGEARQAYTGALGYLNHDGSMDFNILIRTLALQAGRLEFRTGAGIVADSDWQRELAETRAKARGILHGLNADTPP
ncbi:MAG TPA: aminodeoxychorismate synthase component I [Steroidobacteraceae bacterium]|jgi:anthranilate synthase component 1|nr:aminodeoxychorismate synthase component I [Steroidobacteraceae bacterium]